MMKVKGVTWGSARSAATSDRLLSELLGAEVCCETCGCLYRITQDDVDNKIRPSPPTTSYIKEFCLSMACPECYWNVGIRAEVLHKCRGKAMFKESEAVGVASSASELAGLVKASERLLSQFTGGDRPRLEVSTGDYGMSFAAPQGLRDAIHDLRKVLGQMGTDIF